MKDQTFLAYYADQFNASVTNKGHFYALSLYLEGLRDGLTQQLSDEAIRRMIRCEEALQAAESLVDVLHRERIGSADSVQALRLELRRYSDAMDKLYMHSPVVRAAVVKFFGPIAKEPQ